MADVHPPIFLVREAVQRALAEDLTPLGDMTASLVAPEAYGQAAVMARAAGVLAGRLCADEAFRQVDDTVRARWDFDDGAEVDEGDRIGQVEGPLASILTAERTALNFLSRLSGVASLTRRYVRAAKNECRILDTRKTTPGLRALEKAAVRAGGGANHRGSLSDFILIKDNHLGNLSVADAVRRARLQWPSRTVEVECDSIDQVRQAVGVGADVIMLDNMTPTQVRECVRVVDGACPIEVSGGVTLETVGEYAEAGADFISVGAITHSAPILDIALDLETP
jgi:nicotinate-nucleotide pyrophosphorylase (carboxylating)